MDTFATATDMVQEIVFVLMRVQPGSNLILLLYLIHRASHTSGIWKDGEFVSGTRTTILNDGNILSVDIVNEKIRGGRFIGPDNRVVPKTAKEIEAIFEKMVGEEVATPPIDKQAVLIQDKQSDFYQVGTLLFHHILRVIMLEI